MERTSTVGIPSVITSPRVAGIWSALLAWGVLALTAGVGAAEWPTYRADSARSGFTAENLPADLSLRWTCAPRHAPQPAWSGRDTRMPFDRAFHAVIAGDSLFFGSSVDGKVYALDAATGAERWTFFTGGPVRLSPTVWRDRVFVVSDDGFLYCLAARDGKVAWKRRGGPSGSLALGNGRMISRWPARGGPVVADGVVYWAAGIWPSEGVFIYAQDALTGKVLWCNDTAGGLFMPQPHPGSVSYSGVSAQGHLLVVGDKLLVPTGRAVPAVFSRADGKLLYFHLQPFGKAGGASVAATDAQFFNGGLAFDLATGKQAFKAGADPLAMAVTPQAIVCATAKEIVAVDRGNLWRRQEVTDATGKATTQTVFAEPVWRAPNPHAPTSSLVVAGDKAVVGRAGRVSVLDMGSQTVLFSAAVEGEPLGLAVAGGRLYVSTDKGVIHCFGGGRRASPKTLQAKRPVSADAKAAVAAADEIIRRTGITEGYCLDLACGDGGLAMALAKRTKLHIVAMESDAEQVALARQKLDAAGLYGVRVSVHHGDARDCPSYFANLIVSGRAAAHSALGGALRALRPYGGEVCLGPPGAMRTVVRGELPGAGQWTHQYADPANTNCSTDAIVKAPLGVLWFNDLNFQMPSRHGRGPAPLFYNGLLFLAGLNGIRCVDAYNGRVLWDHPLTGLLQVYDGEHEMGVSATGGNLCVGEQGLFVRTDDKCLRIDPATGKLLVAFDAPAQPDGQPGKWGMVACVGDTLIGTVANTEHLVTYRFKPGDMQTQWTESSLLFALDAATGALKWTWRPERSLRHNALAIGGGRVFVIDRDLALSDRTREKKRSIPDEGFTHPAGSLVALDLASGQMVWRSDEDIFGTLLALSEEHQTLLVCYQDWRFKLASELGGRMAAFDTATGKRRWDIKARYSTRPILHGRTVFLQPGAWDLLTGEPKDFKLTRAYGCGIPCASQNLMLFRSGTLGYVDLQHPRGTHSFGGIRPGCWVNVVPAGGLALMPDATDRCTCSYLIKASVALQPWGLSAPRISPGGGVSATPVQVELDASLRGESLRLAADAADIRYTLDGASPTADSPRYTEPITVAKTATLKARAFADGSPPSPVSEAAFVIDASSTPLDAGPRGDSLRLDGTEWSVFDSPGARPPASKWEVKGGVATETSNTFVGIAADPNPTTERPGTLRIYGPGQDFADGELSLELSSSDNDSLGVAFRLQGSDRYYLWAMDAQRGFHILACKNGADYRVLASSQKGYVPNQWYGLRVVLKGPTMTVYLDGEKDLEAADASFAKGTFGFYAWGCAGAKFRGVKWTPRP